MKIIASGCSFSKVVRTPSSHLNDDHIIGRDWMDMLQIYSRAFEKNRPDLEAKHPGQFIDIKHDEFVQNPWPDLEKVYAAAGATISDEGKVNMQTWLDENQPGKHGKHEYDIADYGIEQSEIVDLFSGYIQRYQLNMS
jgi:hypothetical protein